MQEKGFRRIHMQEKDFRRIHMQEKDFFRQIHDLQLKDIENMYTKGISEVSAQKFMSFLKSSNMI